MTRWGCVPFSNNLYQNICISTKQLTEKCFRHTKDHIDFSLSKKPPSQKFIENSTFNSLVNSRLIIKSYKKGEKRSLTGAKFQHPCLSRYSNQRQLVSHCLDMNAALSLCELSLKSYQIVCRE